MQINKDLLLNDFLDVKRSILSFLRSPVQGIQKTPDWPWPKILATHIVFAAACGFIAGFLEDNILRSTLGGIFIMPILTIIFSFASSLFFYYSFQIFAGKTVSFRKIYTIVLFANFPNFIFQIISTALPPVTLIGLGFAALLIIVGFVENFQLTRKLVTRIILVPYILFFVLWIKARIDSNSYVESWQKKYEAPEVHLGQ